MRSLLFSIRGLLILVLVGVAVLLPAAQPQTAQASTPVVIDSLTCEQIGGGTAYTGKFLCMGQSSGGEGSHTHRWYKNGGLQATYSDTYSSHHVNTCVFNQLTTVVFTVTDSSGAQVSDTTYLYCTNGPLD